MLPWSLLVNINILHIEIPHEKTFHLNTNVHSYSKVSSCRENNGPGQQCYLTCFGGNVAKVFWVPVGPYSCWFTLNPGIERLISGQSWEKVLSLYVWHHHACMWLKYSNNKMVGLPEQWLFWVYMYIYPSITCFCYTFTNTGPRPIF